MDSLFQKNLADLVKGLRVTMVGEGRYLSQAMADVRREIKFTDPHVKTVALQKLMYIQMLQGLDVSWAAFHVVEVMSLPRFSHRQVGYQAASQFFSDNTDVMLLITNLLKKDLASPNQYEAGMALNCLASVVTPDLAWELLADVFGLLHSGRPYLKKKAAALLIHFVRRYPGCLRMAIRRLTERMDDCDIGVKCATVSTLCEMAVSNPSPYLPLAPDLYQLLVSSSNTWLIIKLVKLFGILAPLEPRLGRKLAEPLHAILTKTQARSLVFECIRTITVALPNHLGLVKACVLKLREFLESGDQNLKYLGLKALSNLMPLHVGVIAPYRDSVLACLDRLDPCVQRMSLSLLAGMVSESSVRDTVRVLLRFMRTAEGRLRDDLVSAILSMCGRDHYRMLHDFPWYVAVLVDLAKIPESIHGQEVARQLVDIVLRVEGIRAEAVNQLRSLLIDPVLLGGAPKHPTVHHVLAAAAWVTGEYALYVADHRQMLEALLQPRVKLLPPRVQAVYVQAILKIYLYASTRNDRMLYVTPARSPRSRSRSSAVRDQKVSQRGAPTSPRSLNSPYGSGGSNSQKLPVKLALGLPSLSLPSSSSAATSSASSTPPAKAEAPPTASEEVAIGGDVTDSNSRGHGSDIIDDVIPSGLELSSSVVSESGAGSQQGVQNLMGDDAPGSNVGHGGEGGGRGGGRREVEERLGGGVQVGAEAISAAARPGGGEKGINDDVAAEASPLAEPLHSTTSTSLRPVAVGVVVPSGHRSGAGVVSVNERDSPKRGLASTSGNVGGRREVSGHRRGGSSGWDRTEVDGLGSLIRAHIDVFESVDLEVQERLGNLVTILDQLGISSSSGAPSPSEGNATSPARSFVEHQEPVHHSVSEGRQILLTMGRLFREEHMIAVSRNAQKRVPMPNGLVLEHSLDSLDGAFLPREDKAAARDRYGGWEDGEIETIVFAERRNKQAGNSDLAALAKQQLEEHRQKNDIYYLSSPSSSSKKNCSSSSGESAQDDSYPVAQYSQSLRRMPPDSGNTDDCHLGSEFTSNARDNEVARGEARTSRKAVRKLLVKLDEDDPTGSPDGSQSLAGTGRLRDRNVGNETEREKDEPEKRHRNGAISKGVRSSHTQQKTNRKKIREQRGDGVQGKEENEARVMPPRNLEQHGGRDQLLQENGNSKREQGARPGSKQVTEVDNLERHIQREVPLIDLE